MPNPVVHFEIGCRDKEKSAAFYEQAFGWATAPYGPLSKGIATGEQTGVQGHITALGHEPHAYVLVYVQVDDVPAALESVVAAGGASHIGPLNIPGRDEAFAWFTDPDGNMLGLIGPALPENG